MKRIISIFFATCMLLLSLSALFACEDGEHVHSFEDTLSYDATHHWYDASCEHKGELIIDKEEHSFGNDGLCTDCGFARDTSETGGLTATEWLALFEKINLEKAEIAFSSGDDNERKITAFGNVIFEESTVEGETEEKYVYLCSDNAYLYVQSEGAWVRSSLDTDSYDTKGYLIALDIGLDEALTLSAAQFVAFDFDKNTEKFRASIPFGEKGENRSVNLLISVADGQILSIEAEFKKNSRSEKNLKLSFDSNELKLPYVPTEGLEFTLIDDGANPYYAVSGIGEVTDKFIVVPNMHMGLPVKAIAAEAFLNSQIETLVISDGISEIGGRAFKGCASLTYVYAEGTITSVGDEAFDGAPLKYINFPTVKPGK